jgi:hypothetical protein
VCVCVCGCVSVCKEVGGWVGELLLGAQCACVCVNEFIIEEKKDVNE